jgi:ElaB/YqjD/DUF883 family membrane-anchored ribosome-binding protein
MAERSPEPLVNQELPEAEKQPLPVSETPPIAEFESVEVVAVTELPSVTDRVKERASRVADQARYRSSALYDQAQNRVAEARAKAQRGLRDAQAQARYLANRYPLQVVAGIAGAAFLTGMLLRFWRSSRYE